MESKPTLLIVDDEKHTREGLRRALQGRFDVYISQDVPGARGLLEGETIDLVLTDLRLGAESGMDLLKHCQRLNPAPICLMMTAFGSVDTAVEAMRAGAYDYVTKPIQSIDKLEMLLLRALKGRSMEAENKRLKEELNKKFGLENLIGESPRMVEIFDVIRQVADSRATVLVEGESGTGKEIVARAIHQLSGRRDKPFVAVHCAALSEHILESELFGHEKGAFTGAHERRIGRFEQADHGTVFLDEIGEIDASTQVKLLRVLGERAIERVGGNKPIEVDVRLVAATNKSLTAMVKEGTFREDLYYRIHVVRIEMPPLRERREDIPLLARHFLREACRENGRALLSLTPAVEQALLSYDWPGNVRELRAAIEHGVVLCRGDEIALKDLPPSISGHKVASTGCAVDTLNLEQVEKSLILTALERSGGNRTEAAKLLGISRRTLHRKLNDYALEK